MGEEIAGEVREPELGGFDQVAHEGQWILQDALEGRTGFLDVAKRARLNDIENNFSQIPNRVAGPGEKVADEIAENGGHFHQSSR